MAPSWGVWGPPWLQVGALGTILAPSWWSRGHLGSKLGGQEVILAPSWGIWGPSWLQVGGSGVHLGSKLGGLGAILAPSCGVWGPSWLQVGASGAILAPSWGVWGHLGSKLEGPGAILEPRAKMTSKSDFVDPPPGTRFLRHLPRGLLIFIIGKRGRDKSRQIPSNPETP